MCSNVYVKVGDMLIFNVMMDVDVFNFIVYIFVGEVCMLRIFGMNVFTCDVVVSSTTIEGFVNFMFDGIKSFVFVYFDVVNMSYIELKMLFLDGVVMFGGDCVIIDWIVLIFDFLAMYSFEVVNKMC